MARPKGTGGRSLYDRYRKFTRSSGKRRVTKSYRFRDNGGKFMKKSNSTRFDKAYQRPRYRGKKSRFDK